LGFLFKSGEVKKYYISIIACLVLNAATAQKTTSKINNLYYLLDTGKTQVADRMWTVMADRIFKYYTIKCPCLKNDGEPTFVYDIERKGTGTHLSPNQLKKLKLISLSDLILKVKQIENNGYKRDCLISLIEPDGNKYIIHEMFFVNPAIKIISPPDVIERKQ
jgi:hypothetical protein